MFETLTDRLDGVFRRLTRRGKLTEDNIQEALREVRMALLEADVNYKVVKEFISRVREQAVGEAVMKSLSPSQQVIKVVHDELVRLMGERATDVVRAKKPPTVVLLVGLQGSGKTTTAGKLALLYRETKRCSPLLVAADIYRPAAVDQLVTIGKQIKVPVFEKGTQHDPVDIAREGVSFGRDRGFDPVIVDTAGRLHIDSDLMEELRRIRTAVSPHEILLVADAMTGQDAVNMASQFNEELDLTGVILTKMDGDARGGAALSIREVTAKPIKFVGMGEKLEPLEPFHPERMASRILGMGDVMSLIEKAEKTINREEAIALQEKIRQNTFTLEDFRNQLQQVRKLGPLEQVMSMIPGLGQLARGKNMDASESELKRIEAIINSMTKKERDDYTIINASRRRRIARGSGTNVQDVNRLLKQFVQTRKLMRGFQKGMLSLPGLLSGKLKARRGNPKFPF